MLPLCAAENVVSAFSKIPLDTFLQEKYIMGGTLKYQENQNFIGSHKLFQIYQLLQKQCSTMFHCKYADARTLSGVNAVMTLLMSLFSSGDTILISSEDCGGHGSMPKICHRLGIRTIDMPYNYDLFDFDYEKCNKLLEDNHINGVLICISDIIRMPQLYQLHLPKECTMIFDATQILGLIATNSIENPLHWFEDYQRFILMGATHKTLPGPTCGLIMTNNLSLAKSFDTLINPDYLRNNQLHHIVSLILTLMELEVHGNAYSNAIITNSNHLGELLTSYDFHVLRTDSGYTETHQLFLSMPLERAETFYEACGRYDVSLNLRNKQLYKNCGIRIGTQEISRYGWLDKEISEIAQILRDIRDEQKSTDIPRRIHSLSSNKKIQFTLPSEYYLNLHSVLHNSQF